MEDVDLANLIADRIKGDVDVFEVYGTTLLIDVDSMPVVNIMEETEDGPRLRFVIRIEDVRNDGK